MEYFKRVYVRVSDCSGVDTASGEMRELAGSDCFSGVGRREQALGERGYFIKLPTLKKKVFPLPALQRIAAVAHGISCDGHAAASSRTRQIRCQYLTGRCLGVMLAQRSVQIGGECR